jgi:hypothetical protein
LLDKKNISTGDYMYGKGIYCMNDYQKEEFVGLIVGVETLYGYQFEELIFEFLSDKVSFVRGSDLYDAIDFYRRTKPKDKIKQEKREMNKNDIVKNLQKDNR